MVSIKDFKRIVKLSELLGKEISNPLYAFLYKISKGEFIKTIYESEEREVYICDDVVWFYILNNTLIGTESFDYHYNLLYESNYNNKDDINTYSDAFEDIFTSDTFIGAYIDYLLTKHNHK